MLLILLLSTKLLTAHAFHVSVCDIGYNSNDKHLKISVRLFLDDLENAIRTYKDQPKLDITSSADSTFIHNSINEYLLRNLQFEIADIRYVPSYLGGEVEQDVMWCYLEVKNLDLFDRVRLTNTIMTELFDDQENLVTITRNDESRSIRFTNENVVDLFLWE